MKLLVLFYLLFLLTNNIFSQSNPNPFDLSQGDYSFNEWNNDELAETYPLGMIFHHTTNPTLAGFNPLANGSDDWTCGYNLSSRSRFYGLGENGIGIIATGDAQYNDCISGTSSSSRYVGAVVLALNTLNRDSLNLSFKCQTISQSNRTFTIRLQYRYLNNSIFTNWQDVPGPIEYLSSTTGNQEEIGPILLPNVLSNKANIQLRWLYYQLIDGSGARPNMRLDDIHVSSIEANFKTITLNELNDSVFCVDSNTFALGHVLFNSSGVFNDNFNIMLSDKNGDFSNSVIIGNKIFTEENPQDSISFIIPENTENGDNYLIRIETANDGIISNESIPLKIINGLLQVTQISANILSEKIELTWVNPLYCFNEIIIIASNNGFVSSIPIGDGSQYTADTLYGNGSMFNDGYVVYKGNENELTVAGLINHITYYFSIFTRNNDKWSEAAEIMATPIGEPYMTEILCPLYIQGKVTTNNQRVPMAFLASFVNLIPNAKYRYYSKAVLSSDTETSAGAGNNIFVCDTSIFGRTTTTSFATQGSYGEFISNNLGNYTGWFILESTGNNRYSPGNFIFPRIYLNNGNDGENVSFRFTSPDSIKVLSLSNNADSISATGIVGITGFNEKSFVSMYSSADAERPLFISHVESSGLDFESIGNFASFYTSNVSMQLGNWGGIIPNINNDGIKLIQNRDINNGEIINEFISDNGYWFGVSTINPSGGNTNPIIIDFFTLNNVNCLYYYQFYNYADELFFKNLMLNNYKISIFDISGKLLMLEQFYNSNYSLKTGLQKGLYIINIKSNNYNRSHKFIVY